MKTPELLDRVYTISSGLVYGRDELIHEFIHLIKEMDKRKLPTQVLKSVPARFSVDWNKYELRHTN